MEKCYFSGHAGVWGSKFWDDAQGFGGGGQRDVCEVPGRRPGPVRALLIQAGQVEQAVEDAEEDGSAATLCREITNRIAEAFYTRWAQVSGKPSNSPGASGERWHEVRNLLDKLASCAEMGVTVKTPEGFEFYGLYPEQYAASAQKWAEEHREAKGEPVEVVGIRSIGTSLSAVVMSALQAAGHVARRCTVRLSGHPYQRKLPELPRGIDPAGWAIVVDEGPGASGSSMAGTVEALIAAGLQTRARHVLPGPQWRTRSSSFECDAGDLARDEAGPHAIGGVALGGAFVARAAWSEVGQSAGLG